MLRYSINKYISWQSNGLSRPANLVTFSLTRSSPSSNYNCTQGRVLKHRSHQAAHACSVLPAVHRRPKSGQSRLSGLALSVTVPTGLPDRYRRCLADAQDLWGTDRTWGPARARRSGGGLHHSPKVRTRRPHSGCLRFGVPCQHYSSVEHQRMRDMAMHTRK